jgi:E3 ubiquitin-protein ligase BRE1
VRVCRAKPNAAQLVARLEADLRAQRDKCSSFIEEVESLSVMFGDLEAENARLVKLLAEKDSVLSKVMGEKLRGRQQLATVKEEARSLAQGREFDQEKIKNLTMQVSVSKRAVLESALAANRAADEARCVAQQLVQQRNVASEATVSARTTAAERDAVQNERDAAVAQAEDGHVKGETSAFVGRRLAEANEEVKRQLAEEVARRREAEAAAAANGAGAGGNESLRDEIIQELMKKLHCSVVTNQPKEVALVRCGHMLSRQCVDQLVSQRSRKCPLCGLPFSGSDVLNVFLD